MIETLLQCLNVLELGYAQNTTRAIARLAQEIHEKVSRCHDFWTKKWSNQDILMILSKLTIRSARVSTFRSKISLIKRLNSVCAGYIDPLMLLTRSLETDVRQTRPFPWSKMSVIVNLATDSHFAEVRNTCTLVIISVCFALRASNITGQYAISFSDFNFSNSGRVMQAFSSAPSGRS